MYTSLSQQYNRSMFRRCLGEQYEDIDVSLVYQLLEMVEMKRDRMEVTAQYWKYCQS